MIATTFYKGQGLGNQLWAYCVVRSIATRLGYEYGYLGTKRFKGSFPSIDFGTSLNGRAPKFPIERIPPEFNSYYKETVKRLPDGTDVSPVDLSLLEIPDGTLIDGTFQAEAYLLGRPEVQSWLRLDVAVRDICVVNIRGGEFRGVSSLFLPRDYYSRAMAAIAQLHPGIKFEIVTDDPRLAHLWFPELPVYSSGGVLRFHGGLYIHPPTARIMSDFSRLQSAKYLVLSNSSFSWWGAYSNPHVEITIAPKYWARYNTGDGVWSNGDSLTSGWLYLDKAGGLSTFEECLREAT